MNARSLEGKVAVVTGASKGIGAEIARQLAREGASVVVNYASSRSGGEKVVSEIQSAGGKAIAVGANLASPEEVEALFKAALEAFGKIDILVNNAGVYELAPLEQITPEHYHRQFNTNVLGLILATQQAARHMTETGGSIINVSSTVTRMAIPGFSVYGATKAAVDSLTRTYAAELGPRKIRVNAVNPGMVVTEGAHSAGFIESDFRKTVESQTPLGRIGQVQDIAPAVIYFASDASSWVTGQMLFLNGGTH